MTPNKEYLDKLSELLEQDFAPIKVADLPKGLTFFSTVQLIAKFESFVPGGVLTPESIYETLTELGYELAEIKPFSYVWVMQHIRA